MLTWASVPSLGPEGSWTRRTAVPCGRLFAEKILRLPSRNGSQGEPGARRQCERALGQGGAHGVPQGRFAGIVERGVEGAGGGTGGAGERLPVVVEVGVVDARLERAAGDALQAGAAEPLDEVALAHAGARLLV